MENYLSLITNHFRRVHEKGLANYGPCPSPMWVSSMETSSKVSEKNYVAPTHYRSISAPCGCNLYYDQILLVSSYILSDLTDGKFTEMSDAYVSFFLENCIAKNGLFLWGNHYYWDILKGKVVKFVGEEVPEVVDFEKETGDYHEIRPIPPAWEIFWKISPERTEREIRCFISNSLFDSSGGFNRHADRKKGCAFLESGGIMISSLAWLYSKTGDSSLIEIAEKIINFSYSHRDKNTGLIENNPTVERWDRFVSTTEIGLWGSCLLNAVRWTGKQSWIDIVKSVISAYLKYGYDEKAEKYLGQICVSTGKSPFDYGDRQFKLTPFQPGRYSDTWRQFFPSHDYPLQFAECCLDLHRMTGDEIFRTACFRWAEQIMKDYETYRDKNRILYAERYGRCIHFLWRCWKILHNESFLSKAKFFARQAVENLYESEMFRSHTQQHRYESVDGLGYLFLSLIAIETGNDPEMLGSFW
ncbi:MAG: hypothetical protein NC906_05420 [Candidatus Omnitrophica bacterium]|nr:hypothetical protein [Candidatus Omnitrophota bacterium]